MLGDVEMVAVYFVTIMTWSAVLRSLIMWHGFFYNELYGGGV